MPEIKTIEVPFNVAKESKEVIDALTHIVKEVKEKKNVQEILLSSLQKLITAVEGVEKVDDEFKSEAQADTVAYAGREIVNALRA